jgi:hypothetical protein
MLYVARNLDEYSWTHSADGMCVHVCIRVPEFVSRNSIRVLFRYIYNTAALLHARRIYIQRT